MRASVLRLSYAVFLSFYSNAAMLSAAIGKTPPTWRWRFVHSRPCWLPATSLITSTCYSLLTSHYTTPAHPP
eukprot:609183-Pyramimonas_sp.AAC.1